jgi:hypothetical protein
MEYIIVYLTGVIFDLAVIAYLNERKGEMYWSGLALYSWTALFVVPVLAINAVLESICNFFCFLFRKRHENVRQNFKDEKSWRICQN